MSPSTLRPGPRPARWLAAALALAAAAVAAPAPAVAADLPVVRFQDYPGSGNLMIRVARSKGWCQQAGIVCELKVIPAAPLGVQALIGGSIDVSETPIDVVAAAVLRGAKIKTVVGAAVSNFFQVDATAKLPMPHEAQGYPALMQDFKGRKIGVVARGSSSEAMFTYLLKEAGLSAEDVSYVAVGAPNTAFAALRAGQVDAAVTWEPAGIMCELSKACKVVYRGDGATKPELLQQMYGANTGLVMRDEQIQAQPEIAKAVVKLAQQASAFINDRANLDEVQKISDEYFKFDMPQGDKIARYTLERGLDAGTFKTMVRRSAVQATLKYLAETKQLTQLPTVDQLVWSGAPTE